jgi:IS30 family transposase
MKRNQKHDGTHLTLDERKVIQIGIENGSTKADIARTIGKDATTVAKEIRKHRTFKPRNTFNNPVVCAKRGICATKKCVRKCANHEDPKCTRRDKSPGACNKCPDGTKCRLDKYYYDAETADKVYRHELSDCREGVNLTTQERDVIGEIIAPLLKQGQSVHQIMSAHSEIGLSERTIYNYIKEGIFKPQGVDNFSLKEQVNRKPRKTKCKPRKEPANYTNRKYLDFLRFKEENPDIPVVEMDTLYNNPSGPYLQTFIFEKVPFMLGFLHEQKTSASMAETLNGLQARLGKELFSKLFPVILTDRGSEFEKFSLFELGEDTEPRLNIFYCDPMQSSQKPHVENGHNYVRDIIPNGYPLDDLIKADIDLMFSHINSTPRRSLGDKSPFEVFSFFFNLDAAELFGLTNIPRDEVILKPSLIYARNRKLTPVAP